MQITIIRKLSEDYGMLESTWHHVSEEDGVRLQLQEDLNYVQERYLDSFHADIVMRFVEQRKVVNGSFHPGRRIPPRTAVTYENVYDCIIPKSHPVEAETILKRITTIMRSEFGGEVLLGNCTQKEVLNVA